MRGAVEAMSVGEMSRDRAQIGKEVELGNSQRVGGR